MAVSRDSETYQVKGTRPEITPPMACQGSEPNSPTPTAALPAYRNIPAEAPFSEDMARQLMVSEGCPNFD